MLEKPDIPDEKITACLRDEHGLLINQIAFLPLGADLNTAVYRAFAKDGTQYFVKVRTGIFDETSVTLPNYLSDQGIEHIINPLPTRAGQLWVDLDTFKLILYPFVEGHNAYEVSLPDRHWRDLGVVLQRIHTIKLPSALKRSIQREAYSPQWRETLKRFLARAGNDAYDDPAAKELTAVLQARRDEIHDLVGRAERLSEALQARAPELVLCHSDIHAGNLLIVADETFYIVDWDNPLLAYKERDLMYIGGGLMGGWRTPQAEETLFYQGYGPTRIDPIGLAYYRYERIVQDMAIYCEQLLLSSKGGEDREQSLGYFLSYFVPGGTMDIAYLSDKTLNDQ